MSKDSRSFTGLRLERDGNVVTVTIDRPAARNAMDGALMDSLTEVARQLRRDPTVRAVILTGQAEFFSAGVDLQMSSSRSAASASLLELRSAVAAGPDMCQAWEDIEAVTIVAIEGFCVGGGLALALSCDFRIMGEGSFVRLPEVPLGMNMSWRSLPRLTALVGPECERGRYGYTLRVRAQDRLSELRDQLSSIRHDAAERVLSTGRTTNAFVHRNPWAAVGLASGLGILAGLLLNSRR